MPRYRIRYEEPSSGGAFTSLVLGALAGFAVGVLVAQKSGGIKGIAAGVKRRFAELADEASAVDTAAHPAHDSAFDEALDEDELEDDLLDEDDLVEVEELEVDELEDDAVAVGAEADTDDTGLDVVLEEEVLEAFQADPTLRERAIDISAVGDAVIELSGWVDSDAESHLAAAVARRVPGVESVVNRLAVGNADTVETQTEPESRAGKKKAKDSEATGQE